MMIVARCRSDGQSKFTTQSVITSKSIREAALCLKPIEALKSQFAHKVDKFNDFPLTPIQTFHFLVAKPEDDSMTQSVLLKLSCSIDVNQFDSVIESLVLNHPMLRTRFEPGPSKAWRQATRPFSRDTYYCGHYSTNDIDSIKQVADQTRSILQAQTGPVFAAALFTQEQDRIMFLTAHHLVIDIISWYIILADMEGHIRRLQLNPGRTKQTASAQSTSFPLWAHLQEIHLRQLSPETILSLPHLPQSYSSFWGMTDQPNQYGDMEHLRFSLSAFSTAQLLGSCNKALNTEPVDIFLGIASHTFLSVFADRESGSLIFDEHHGREPWLEELDVSQTVGWFTTMQPVPLAKDHGSMIDAIAQVKDSRRQFSDHGWLWFSSQFPKGHPPGISPPVEIIFNYFGAYKQFERHDAVFQVLPWAGPQPTEEGGPNAPRLSLLELSLTINDGKLMVTLFYNRRTSRQSGLRQWMNAFERSLVECTQSLLPMARRLTLSDFPLLRMTHDSLNIFLNSLAAKDVEIDDIEDAYPATMMQQGLLISQIQRPSLYSIQCFFSIKTSNDDGHLLLKRLHCAWQQIIERHNILRTILVENISGGGSFGQLVLRSLLANIVELRCGTDTEARNPLDQLKPVDYGTARLPYRLAASVATGLTDRIHCRLDISHAIFDGVSLPLLLHEIARAYGGSPAQPRPLPFGQYVAHIMNESPKLQTSIQFWESHLAEISPCILSLNGAVVNQESLAKLQTLSIPLNDADVITLFCRRNSLTVTTVLHTAWALVLRSYCAVNTPCFGYLSSGRDLPLDGIHASLGVFINMLIFRAKLSDDAIIMDVLRAVQSDTMNAWEHQACSLGDILRTLNVQSSGLFNSVVSHETSLESGLLNYGDVSVDDVKLYDPSEV